MNGHRDHVAAEDFEVFRGVNDAVDQAVVTVFCQKRNFGRDFSLCFRCTTQQVLEIQLDTPLWSNASEEAVFVEA